MDAALGTPAGPDQSRRRLGRILPYLVAMTLLITLGAATVVRLLEGEFELRRVGLVGGARR